MKISIITATYNSSSTVRDTIESVLQQTYTDIEYIIVDGVSKDDTLSIVESYAPKFQGRLRWISEPDRGIYDAMNKGIAMATGDIVGILNSDDMYKDQDVLDVIANTFLIKNVDCVYGNLEFVDANNTDKIVRTWIGSQHTPGLFLNGWHPAHPTFYVRRSHFEKLGYFDTDLAVSADFELMLRFIERAQLSNSYIDKCLVKMRQGGESTGSIKNIIRGNRNILRAFKKNGYDVTWLYLIKRLFPKAINALKTKIKK